ncbi:MAG TPA: methylated-DNA--[protein]-cysteine S-methyltransferase [Clostridia bacterium]|jgi:methylated-DNA-protein-cysteine methyltransferase-like protein|nr:methylated-DNA--[protein]-cysteine S-methyltransferase [Clostridia bacterium]HRX41131.1 methylated-DNA--[protein]-cysteine S-methyltransferase [Clostridia bacterium]
MKEFDERIYRLAAMIPEGKVATYGQLAAMAGFPRMARAAGSAMKNAPADLDIPCHRVVSQSGDLAPSHVFESREHQRRMLESEGVIFKPNGKINMQLSRWKPL